jgi:catechol 2,3-dioxygenase-like lactoylglutathione lyase family enzyme
MPSVHGILETALYVKDPKEAADFYRRLFEFETLLDVERPSLSMLQVEVCSYFLRRVRPVSRPKRPPELFHRMRVTGRRILLSRSTARQLMRGRVSWKTKALR